MAQTKCDCHICSMHYYYSALLVRKLELFVNTSNWNWFRLSNVTTLFPLPQGCFNQYQLCTYINVLKPSVRNIDMISNYVVVTSISTNELNVIWNKILIKVSQFWNEGNFLSEKYVSFTCYFFFNIDWM